VVGDEPQDVDFGCTSIYGARTRRGLVQVTYGREQYLVTPAKAREMATFLLEAASAAEGDEVLMHALDRAGLSMTRAAQVLMAVRQERQVLERRAREEARRAIAFDQKDADPTE